MPMRRVIEVPPRRGMTGMLRKTGHLAGVVNADALRRIILMHLHRVIGQRDRHLRKAHKLVIVVAQIIRVILIAPVEVRHTIATLLRGQRITELIGIVRRAIDGVAGLNASLPVLHEPVRRVLFRHQQHMAPALIVSFIAGIATLMRVTVERIAIVGSSTGHPMRVTASQLPAKALGQPLPITGGDQETAIVGIALAPQQTPTTIARIPVRSTFADA